MNTRTVRQVLLPCLLSLALLGGCATNPVTGKQDFVLFRTDLSAAQVTKWIRQAFGKIDGKLNFFLFDARTGRYPTRPSVSKSVNITANPCHDTTITSQALRTSNQRLSSSMLFCQRQAKHQTRRQRRRLLSSNDEKVAHRSSSG